MPETWSAAIKRLTGQDFPEEEDEPLRDPGEPYWPDLEECDFEGRLRGALIEYLHRHGPYIDFATNCPHDPEGHDHKDAEELIEHLVAIDEELLEAAEERALQAHREWEEKRGRQTPLR